jgi:hypothetical protein
MVGMSEISSTTKLGQPVTKIPTTLPLGSFLVKQGVIQPQNLEKALLLQSLLKEHFKISIPLGKLIDLCKLGKQSVSNYMESLNQRLNQRWQERKSHIQSVNEKLK